MNKYLVGLFLMFAATAFGAEVGSHKDADSWLIILSNDQGFCPASAAMFEIFNEVGKKEIQGCWKGIQDNVFLITEAGYRFVLEASKFTWK